jgi:polysaccharide biosynthesis protein PslG
MVSRILFPLLMTTILLIACAPLKGVTGEEELAPQVRGVGHWLSGRVRPYPDLAPLEPVRHAGVYPFGVNTFLQSESEPDKVEQSLDMIAEAGIGWIRQEFAWEDLEIHREGWYLDLRNNEIRDAWAKYDRIVALAEARDIQIIARLSTPPTWSRAEGDAIGTKAPPTDFEDYGNYVEAVVRRYQGRIRYYQIWNEPNCCEEWGVNTVSPEAYTELLKIAAIRARTVDPDVVILTAPLAPTIALQETSPMPGVPPALNDFLFLQRMYDAGAKEYFDILAVQDYGLWSGPEDRRMRPRVINYARPEYIRDVMIQNGDGQKAIWASEIGWNSAPEGVERNFGYTPEELRGEYLITAFERQQREWHWMGATTVWFFKRPDESEATQSQFYFQLVRPDFTPLPAWEELKEYITTLEPTLYRGYHQEAHWVVRAGVTDENRWILTPSESAVFEQVAMGQAGDTLQFAVEGSALTLVAAQPQSGTVRVTIGDREEIFTIPDLTISTNEPQQGNGRTPDLATDAGKSVWHLPVGQLPAGRTLITLTVEEGTLALDGIIVE